MDKLLTVFEAAEWLALRPATIRRWLSVGRLPRVYVGDRAVRIRESDLRQFIRDGSPKADGCEAMLSTDGPSGRLR